MIDDADELAAALTDTALGGRDVSTLTIPSSRERVFAVPLHDPDLADPERTISIWSQAHALLDRTGRWPVAVSAWGAATAGDATPESFGMGVGAEPPPAVRAEAAGISATDACARLRAEGQELIEVVDWHLDATEGRCGRAPRAADVLAGLPADADVYALDRYLLDWEIAAGASTSADPAQRDDLFTPHGDDGVALLFLPTSSGADSLAYVEFYGEQSVEGATAARLVAILRDWEERWGARLFAHWSTMLQFVVDRPPTDIDQALALTRQHELVAPGTTLLPGTVPRDHARGLIDAPTWFLHERP